MSNTSCSVLSQQHQPMDCAFHPHACVLAIAHESGSVEAYRLDLQPDLVVDANEGWSGDHHEDSCRAVSFTPSGDLLWSASASCQVVIMDASDGREVVSEPGEEDMGTGYTTLLCLDANTAAIGSDDGVVALWDGRADAGAMNMERDWSEQNDHISSLTAKGHDVIATSGDGTIAVYDMRRQRLRAQSDQDADDEYSSAVVCKSGKKVVVGTQSGSLNIFSWGHFEDCSDRFPGHPECIDAVVKFDEDTVLTGSGDGAIRVISVLPNKLLDVVGVHDTDADIQGLALSADRALLASISVHDQDVKLWPLRYLLEDSEDEEEDGEEGEAKGEGSSKPAKRKRKAETSKKTSMKKAQTKQKGQGSKFFEGLL